MQKFNLLLFAAFQLCLAQFLSGENFEEYLNKANNFYRAGSLEEAARTMEEAIQKYPDNALPYSYLGFYRGMQAGATNNFLEAGKLISTAYQLLNKAVQMEPNNLTVRLNRGIMSVNVPPFMNLLESGIQDLELIVKTFQTASDKVPVELVAQAYSFLGDGYIKKDEPEKARAAWQQVVAIAPGTPLAEKAAQNLGQVSSLTVTKSIETKQYTIADVEQLKKGLQREPANPSLYLQLGQAYVSLQNFDEAVKVLEKCIALDSTNVAAYKLLIKAKGVVLSRGYDARIHDDTNLRTNQAFEMVALADRAYRAAPNDADLLLNRGRIGVMMPFFVGRLEQAIKDLEKVVQSTAPPEIKAEASYWLGYAYQKKATTNWIEVVKKYPETDASRMVFESMLPPVKHFNLDEYQKPCVVVDFVLGFRDELAPQTVVWVEDKAGNFIKTIYVSGFSGYAKDKQINLPRWSKSSQFQDVDGVTGASIDLGHHIYVWDLNDVKGKPVKAGDYVVKVEVAYWPSMQYQIVAAPLSIGKKNAQSVVREGNLIPYLELKYFAGQP